MTHSIEIINPQRPRNASGIRCAVFDFDGTLSLLRAGWFDLMHAQMVDALMQTPNHESAEQIRAFVSNLIYSTSGQQTIYQMIRLAEEIAKRGGTPKSAEEYKQDFLNRLLARVYERVVSIDAGIVAPETWMVPGAKSIVQELHARGVTCYIASGTDDAFVKSEAATLGLSPYLAGIFGAQSDRRNHSKRAIIGRIAEQHNLYAGELATFGDGAPEMIDSKSFGGIAIGVATNESTSEGVNGHKREVLIQAGADIIVPDFREYPALLDELFR
jgi:phosphoglycolate phosphatase-like HAD superfamily hydrolase